MVCLHVHLSFSSFIHLIGYYLSSILHLIGFHQKKAFSYTGRMVLQNTFFKTRADERLGVSVPNTGAHRSSGGPELLCLTCCCDVTTCLPCLYATFLFLVWAVLRESFSMHVYPHSAQPIRLPGQECTRWQFSILSPSFSPLGRKALGLPTCTHTQLGRPRGCQGEEEKGG